MKSDWKETTLGEIGKIITGKTPPTKKTEYFEGDVPFVTPRDMNGSKHICQTERYLTSCGADVVKNAYLPKDSVMVSCIGSDMGKVAISGSPSVTNQQINSIIIDEGTDPEYVYYDLSLRQVELKSKASGSAVPILNKGHFSNLPILLPPLPEQKAIAHILGTLDDKIELNRRMNETLEQMARAIFKSWFVDFDPVKAKAEGRWQKGQSLPGLPADLYDLFPDSFQDSPLGPIPRGWKAGCLGDIASNPRRGILPENIDSTTPYIGLNHMPRGSIALNEWGDSEEIGSNKFEFKNGEILFGKLRPYFHKVGIAPVDGVCSTDILVVAPKSDDLFGIVLMIVSDAEFIEYTNAHSTGTRMPRTNWADMSKYEIAIPADKIILKFNDIVKSVSQKIQVNIRQSRTLAAIRDTLLPKLLSGEIRIKEAEKLAGEIA